MNYRQALGFLSSLIDYERWIYRNYEFKLDDYLRFLEKLGNLQDRLKKVVLVAGTKGKGSTAIMLAEILKTHGEKVGLYTSPHLIDYTERIRVNGKKVQKKRFAEIVTSLKPVIESHEPLITFFEAMTTVGFYYFFEQNTSVNVLEVGLGGRLDATNVTRPEISVITRIGYDHTQTLGKTLKKIAIEKCGVLRRGKAAVIANQRPRARKVINEEVEKKGSLGIWAGTDYNSSIEVESVDGLQFSYHSTGLNGTFRLPVLGSHQAENAAAAIAAASVVLSKIDVSRTVKTLAGIRLPSRIQIVKYYPTIILDMSHNPEAASTLRATLDRHFSHHNKRILVIGTTRHKDKSSIINTLAPFFTGVIATQADLPRAEDRFNLVKICRKVHTDCTESESICSSIGIALKRAGSDGLIVITGSIYVAGEAFAVLKSKKDSVSGKINQFWV